MPDPDTQVPEAASPKADAVPQPAPEPASQPAPQPTPQPSPTFFAPPAQKTTSAPAKKSALEILKESFEKGLIDKEEYEKAVFRLLKKEVTGEVDPSPTELKIFRQADKFRIVLEKGEVDIPTDEKTIVKKEGNMLVIRSSSSGSSGDLDPKSPRWDMPFTDTPQATQTPSATKDVFNPAELEEIERAFKSMNNSSQEMIITNEASTLKDDLELIDLRKEFQEKEREEPEEAPEEKKEAEEPGVLDGIIDKVSRLTGRLKPEDKSAKLRSLSLENLKKIRELKEERRAIIGVAYVLKQFLQVRFKIPREVTYHELAEEIKGKNIDTEIKGSLMDFFRKMPIMMYAKVPLNESLPKAYNLAEKTINELSEGLE